MKAKRTVILCEVAVISLTSFSLARRVSCSSFILQILLAEKKKKNCITCLNAAYLVYREVVMCSVYLFLQHTLLNKNDDWFRSISVFVN